MLPKFAKEAVSDKPSCFFVTVYIDVISYCVQLLQEFAKEAVRKKQVVEKLLESPILRDAAELNELTDAWECVRSLEINRSARLYEALQLVSDGCFLICSWIFLWILLLR